MTRLPDSAVEKAKDEAEQWESFRDGASWAAAGLVPAITAVAGPPVGIICGTAAASMIMLGSKKARIAKRKAEDPPDFENFQRRVVARRDPFYEDAFGSSPLEHATVRASERLIGAMAYESAMVRADERAAAAQEMGDRRAQLDRLAEARDYALRATETDVEAERACKDLASEFRRLGVGHDPFDPSRVPSRLDLALPDRTLVMLFRAGFRIEDLRIPLRRTRTVVYDPVAFIAEGLDAAARATGDFGRALGEVAEYAYQAEEE